MHFKETSMKTSNTLFCLAALALAVPALQAHAEPAAPIRVILVGDSIMASKSGYGDALCARFTPEVSCVNLARGGRSSASFRTEGRWDEVQHMLRDGADKYRATYVLVQFGHNDQPGKPGRSTDLATEFPVNMARYAAETRALGGVPVLITPLTRRSFKDGQVRNELADWAEATRRAAAQEHAAVLDLNTESVAAVQQMGQDEADTLAMAPPSGPAAPSDPNKAEPAGAAKSAFDRTHLGAKGAELFSGMVARELAQAVPAISQYLRQR
jgi:lysophospholipase L1-like esterase